MTTDTHLSQLIRLIAGDKAADDILGTLHIDRTFLLESAGAVSRGAPLLGEHSAEVLGPVLGETGLAALRTAGVT